MFPTDFAIFSSSSSSIPLCAQMRANSRPAPRDWASSFSWCGKAEVEPAAVDLEARAEVLLGHGRALDVPARPPLPPRRVPGRVLVRLVRLPEREVPLVLLEVARLLGDHVLELRARELAVAGPPLDTEVDVALGLVGQPAVDELCDQGDDLGNGLGRERLDLGPAKSERVRVLHVPASCLLGQLGARNSVACRGLVDLVVDVRDVLDQLDVVAGLGEPPAKPHREDERARIPEVDPRVDRWTADVHPNRAGRGRQLLEPARKRAVEAHAARLTRVGRRTRRECGARAAQDLVPVERDEDAPELGPARLARQREPERPQVTADRLELPKDLTRRRRAKHVGARLPGARESARGSLAPPRPARAGRERVRASAPSDAPRRASGRRGAPARTRPEPRPRRRAPRPAERRSPRRPGAGVARGRVGHRYAATRARRDSLARPRAGSPRPAGRPATRPRRASRASRPQEPAEARDGGTRAGSRRAPPPASGEARGSPDGPCRG